MLPRVVATPDAASLILKLQEQYGPLSFHLSSGCCDGSVPMCFPQGEFRTGTSDVLWAEVERAPFYISAAQSEYLAHTQLILDVQLGEFDSFSLETREGARFTTRSRYLTALEEADGGWTSAPESPLR
ncbi:MAG: DUF779 domain-containing protein [Acidobacteriota bacterium]|nr:DUF779 domain-containing protein [Acidobacteriota bacterium]